jgi:membrane protein DedA with SNARE-associated domain
MPPDLIAYILNHGYWIIFILVFSQEIGIPNPVPNELILLYAGYLASDGHFNAVYIILIAIAADFIGTSILYGVFYAFRLAISQTRPKWLPLDKIEVWKQKISKRGKWGIFIGRHIPYIRGYTSAAAGLLGISPKIFMPIVLCSAITWSGGLVLLGKILGNNVGQFAADTGWKIMLAGVCVGLIVVGIILPRVFKKKSVKPKNTA